jgi:tetratricopeptide (TPR) repeat protein
VDLGNPLFIDKKFFFVHNVPMKTKAIITFILVLSVGLFSYAGNTEVDEGKIELPYVRLDQGTYDLLKAGQWEEAIDRLYRASRLTASDPNLKYYLVYCHERLAVKALDEERFEDAIEQLDKAVGYVNDLPRLHLELGLCYYGLARYQEAGEAFNRAILLNPGSFLAHKMLGEIYYVANNTEDAREHWRAALKIKPDNKYVKERLSQLDKYNRMSGDLETEVDVMFAVSFDGEQKPRLRELVLEMLMKISRQVGRESNLYPKRQIPVVLLTNQAFFDITGSPEWAGGVYEGHIKVPVDNYDEKLLRIVLAHEYVHAVIFDRLSLRCPWWLNEGLAQYLSGDRQGNAQKLELAGLYIEDGQIPLLEDLPGNLLKGGSSDLVMAVYSLALSAVKYFVDEFGITAMQYALDLMAEGKRFDTAVKQITGYSSLEFQEKWKAAHSPGEH